VNKIVCVLCCALMTMVPCLKHAVPESSFGFTIILGTHVAHGRAAPYPERRREVTVLPPEKRKKGQRAFPSRLAAAGPAPHRPALIPSFAACAASVHLFPFHCTSPSLRFISAPPFLSRQQAKSLFSPWRKALVPPPPPPSCAVELLRASVCAGGDPSSGEAPPPYSVSLATSCDLLVPGMDPGP
jgi:hypothetical protein